MTKRCLACGQLAHMRTNRAGELEKVCEQCQLTAISDAVNEVMRFERNFKAADNTSKIVVDF